MFTSYYAKHGTDRNAVAISVRPPEWYTGVTYPILAPTWEVVRGVKSGNISETEYAIEYLKLIKKRGASPNRTLADLGENAILLCYEKPDDFCHRHIVAWWIGRELGVEVPEISNIKIPSLVDEIFTF